MKAKTEYYVGKMNEGVRYQNYIAGVIKEELGFDIGLYESEWEQLQYGESEAGFEIKYDMIYKDSGNLWIETAEKTAPSNAEYVPSGVFRNDNSWIYAIGNYDILYMFSKKELKRLAKIREIEENNMKTSKGFLLSKEDAEYHSAKIINIKDEEIPF